VGQSLEPLRFRPNILINGCESDSFPEDRWVGRFCASARCAAGSTCAINDA
jgi:uncharacterized protein YcbX